MKNVVCSLIGHDFKVSKEITYHIKEYKCKRCGEEMTIDANGEFVPLTAKLKEINRVLNNVHEKRLERGRRLFMVNP
ncbi:MAG: hypothetical protein Wins2KO_19300 [Winogradskyella sp.]|uniref:hypothetical protein n=1 Tax=Winogradskyella sp. TaxID=1883156 RepID=UPI0025E44EE5|nr:hypothetical protein [Winogradskyella sp.]NRB59722.1 hypothetical protein [Winogradskyella sp.]